MGNNAPQKSGKRLIDARIAGYGFTPEFKRAIKTLGAAAAQLDNRRRALLGKAGPSPLALSLVAVGTAPPTVLGGRGGGPRQESPTIAASRRPAPRPGQPSPSAAAVGQFIGQKTRAVSDNLAFAQDRIRSAVEEGQRWLGDRPEAVRENLKLSGLADYFDMVSKMDMTDASMVTPEQVRLRAQAKLNRPRPDYNTPYYQDIRRTREGLNPLLRQVDAGGRTFADTTTFGAANYLAAIGDTLTNPYSYAQNLEGERYIDFLDSQDARAGQIVGRVAGSLVPMPGGGYVAAARSLPAELGRAALVGGGKTFVHDAIAARGDLEDRFESGLEGGLTDAMYAPLGLLAERGVEDIAPLAAEEYPFLKDLFSTLATTAPKELADAMAEAESRRAAAR
jgi:hypothetical protein